MDLVKGNAAMVKMYVPDPEARKAAQSTRELVDNGDYDSLVNRVQLLQTTDPERIARAEGEVYPYLRVTFRLVEMPKMIVHNYSTHPNFWATTEEFLRACGLKDEDIDGLGDATEQDMNQLLVGSRNIIEVGRRLYAGRWSNVVVRVVIPDDVDPAIDPVDDEALNLAPEAPEAKAPAKAKKAEEVKL